MKRAIIVLFFFCFSFSVIAQQNSWKGEQAKSFSDEPEWVQVFLEKGATLGASFSEACMMVGRSIISVPDHGVERHMMAVYDALSNYAYMAHTQIDSTGMRTEARLDYDLLDTWTDNEKYEYVLLKIYPGRHKFTGRSQSFSEKADNNDSVCEMFECEYSFSAFAYPLRYEVTSNSSCGVTETKILCVLGPYHYSKAY